MGLPINIAWQPLPGSQVLALSCPANHILFEGTRGPGKTDTQLIRFRKRVGVGYGKFWRGVIFDREYKNLDDIISKSERWFNEFDDGARFSGGGGGGRWKWPTGEVLLFRHIKKKSDYGKYHGHEYPFIGWNELTKYPTSEMYDLMMSTNRSSFRPEDYEQWIDRDAYAEGQIIRINPESKYAMLHRLPEIPLEVFSTTNPHGPGHNWVKRRFIDVAEPGEVVRRSVDVFNPRTKKREVITKTQVRIFGSYKENEFLSPEYVAELETMADPNIRAAWLHGDWDVVSGGIFDDVWDRNVHVVPRFAIPKGWALDRSFDWGSTHPFWNGWWAEANGESVQLPNGSTFTPARGSLILLDEWYGTAEIGTNKGLRLGAKAIARGIRDREESLVKQKLIARRPMPGPADNQIDNVAERDTDTIAQMMEKEGISWESSDKAAGSRKIGVQLFRDRLEAAKTGEGPGIYFMSHCTGAISTIPILPRDEDDQDDVDSAAEDHPWDGVRYRVLKGAHRIAKSVKLTRPR